MRISDWSSDVCSSDLIYAIDVDGKRGNYLFGFRGEGVKTGTRIGRNTRENAYGELIRTLPDDPDHVLIAYYNWDALIKDREVAIAARIHTVSGKRDQEVDRKSTRLNSSH